MYTKGIYRVAHPDARLYLNIPPITVPDLLDAMGMTTAPDLTERQLNLIQLGLIIFLVPAAIYMYRHFQSLRKRYPGMPALSGGPEGAALAKAQGLPKEKAR